MKYALLIITLLACLPAYAQVHKCVIEGKTVFSDRPCPDSGPSVGEVIEQQKHQRATDALIANECDDWLATEPALKNSAWDGSVYEVKVWFQRNANNPKSVRYVTWSVVHRHCNGYAVQVRYRAENAMGGTVTESRIFRFNRAGEYTGSDPINWNP